MKSWASAVCPLLLLSHLSPKPDHPILSPHLRKGHYSLNCSDQSCEILLDASFPYPTPTQGSLLKCCSFALSPVVAPLAAPAWPPGTSLISLVFLLFEELTGHAPAPGSVLVLLCAQKVLPLHSHITFPLSFFRYLSRPGSWWGLPYLKFKSPFQHHLCPFSSQQLIGI
jgi:hypothetical protein